MKGGGGGGGGGGMLVGSFEENPKQLKETNLGQLKLF